MHDNNKHSLPVVADLQVGALSSKHFWAPSKFCEPNGDKNENEIPFKRLRNKMKY